MLNCQNVLKGISEWVHLTFVWALQWRHNERDDISNHQPYDCLLYRSIRRRWKISKLRVTDLFAGNSPVTGEFPAQKDSNAENVSIWWRHLGMNYSSQLLWSMDLRVELWSMILQMLEQHIWLFWFSHAIMYQQRHVKTKLPNFIKFDGLVLDCSHSSALTMELLQSCTKPSN